MVCIACVEYVITHLLHLNYISMKYMLNTPHMYYMYVTHDVNLLSDESKFLTLMSNPLIAIN